MHERNQARRLGRISLTRSGRQEMWCSAFHAPRATVASRWRPTCYNTLSIDSETGLVHPAPSCVRSATGRLRPYLLDFFPK
jgi:hypothetical protein